GVAQILEPQQFGELGIPVPGQDPQAPALVLAAREGYAFSNDTAGEEVVALPRPTGTHGYVQTEPHMDALFVAGGAGLRRGVRLDRIRNLDVAPTVAHLLGLPTRGMDGRPLDAILR
ncbi:MAG TPA: alkaline phosphatase family protein, partial [Armatimonadota bacterium]|nr:alkaline phosphatase family protein [Armatimonadota bacterium]